MAQTLCGKVAVAGLGSLHFKRGQSGQAERKLILRAIIAACEDAGIAPSQVDGFCAYGDDANDPARLTQALGTRELRWASMVWGGGGGGSAAAIGQAAAAIATGQATAVVVFRALAQGDSGRLSAAVMAHHLSPHYVAAGLVAPAQICALRAQRLLEHHNVPRSAMEAVVQAGYFHARNNPTAAGHQNSFDHAAYEASRWISEPLRLHDCSRESDGAGALLLVSAERARDLRQKPVYLLAAAHGAPHHWGDLHENEDDYASAGFKSVAARIWTQSGLTPKDVDTVQVYENFSAQAVASLIDHGFCNYENVGEVLTFENLTVPTGRLPINTAGGNIADSFVHGMGVAIEAIRQMRGQSVNTVPGARTCLATGGPAAPLVSSVLFGNQRP